MPNWNCNILSVENSTPEFESFLKEHGFSFEAMATPKRPEKDDIGWDTIGAQVAAWGTKWDLAEHEQKEVADSLLEQGSASFDTAWSPPIEAIAALSEKFPTVDFTLKYYETGMMFFGICLITDGCIDDEYTDSASPAEFRKFLEEECGYDEFDARETVGDFDDEEPDEETAAQES